MIDALSEIDPLSAALLKMRVRTVYTGAADAAGHWAVELPIHTGFKLHFLLKGTAWIEMAVSRTRHFLRAGDCLLVTSGEPLVIASDLGVSRRMTLDEALASLRDGVITINGGGECQTITVHFQFEGHLANVVFRALPPVIQISADDDGAAALRWAIERMRGEFLGSGLGRALMLNHLAPMLLVQILRVHLASGHRSPGLLTALTDPRLSIAIDAMQRRCGHPWSLLELAKMSGLSRAGFALDFKKKVGMPPGEYLAHWRMQIACGLLRDSEDLSITAIANEVGYESESAFSAAFKKIVGCRPGAYRRTTVG